MLVFGAEKAWVCADDVKHMNLKDLRDWIKDLFPACGDGCS